MLITILVVFCTLNMAGEVIVDALPYIDQGYDDPGVREAVSKTILKPKVYPPNNLSFYRHLLWWKKSVVAIDQQKII